MSTYYDSKSGKTSLTSAIVSETKSFVPIRPMAIPHFFNTNPPPQTCRMEKGSQPLEFLCLVDASQLLSFVGYYYQPAIRESGESTRSSEWLLERPITCAIGGVHVLCSKVLSPPRCEGVTRRSLKHTCHRR